MKKTPREEYVRYILEAVSKSGGSSPREKVLQEVKRRMKDVLNNADLETMSGGRKAHWQFKAGWARWRMVHVQGLLKKDSPRGIWEITEKGRRRLQEITDQERRRTQ